MNKRQFLCISVLLTYIALVACGIFYVRQCNEYRSEAIKLAVQCNYEKPLSRRGTIDMLLSKGYEKEYIRYALDNIEIDWAENAAKRASTFCGGHSRKYVYKKLVSEKFSEDEIKYAMKFCEGKGRARVKDLEFKLC